VATKSGTFYQIYCFFYSIIVLCDKTKGIALLKTDEIEDLA